MDYGYPDIRVGDKITAATTGTVTAIDSEIIDLDNGATILRKGFREGQFTHTLVKRARPKVGQVMSPDEIRAQWWKRGTIIRYSPTCTRVLFADGLWHKLDNNLSKPMDFTWLSDDYALVYDPDQK